MVVRDRLAHTGPASTARTRSTQAGVVRRPAGHDSPRVHAGSRHAGYPPPSAKAVICVAADKVHSRRIPDALGLRRTGPIISPDGDELIRFEARPATSDPTRLTTERERPGITPVTADRALPSNTDRSISGACQCGSPG